MANQKQYGLILPDKDKSKIKSSSAPASKSKPKNVFGDDSSGDEESNVDWVKQSLKKQSHGSMQQKASMKVMKQAITDDPSVYEYDEVYDDMTRRKEDTMAKKKADKKPKYIESLLKTAKQRELENELRKEREAQRDRENEGDLYADKEAFVTGSFKKKMAELRKMQDEQAYTDAIDDVTDVTKQKDMSGFYRQLYRDTVLNEDDKAKKDVKIETEGKDKDTKGSDPEVKVERDEDEDEDAKGGDKERSPVTNEGRDRKRSDRTQHDDTRRHDRDRDRISDRDKDNYRKGSDKDRDRERHSDRDYDRERHSDRHYDRERNSDRHYDRDRDRKPVRDYDRNDRDRRSDRDNQRDRGGRDHRENERERSGRDHDHRRSDRENDRDRTDRQRDNTRDRAKQDGDRIRDKGKEPPKVKVEKGVKGEGEASEDVDNKVKIIENENWYDFDVQIERDVKKSFYAKRTVGTVFEEALQRYLERKAVSQVVVYK